MFSDMSHELISWEGEKHTFGMCSCKVGHARFSGLELFTCFILASVYEVQTERVGKPIVFCFLKFRNALGSLTLSHIKR